MKLDDRMKQYEFVTRNFLTCKTPVIIRLDGRAFHTFTKGMNKPFDEVFLKAMRKTALQLCEEISGCKFAYTQSDEISLLLLDTSEIETQAWFKNNLSKIISISASLATLYFNKNFINVLQEKILLEDDFKSLPYESKIFKATFDARAFNIPFEEINNYFIYRQQDCIRNSIQMVGQTNFSHKELLNKKCADVIEMLKNKQIDYYTDFPSHLQRGTCFYKGNRSWKVDMEMPELVRDKTFIERKIK